MCTLALTKVIVSYRQYKAWYSQQQPFCLQGEPFSFLEPVDVEGAVEIWMGAVEAMMKKSLHQFGKEAVAAYPDLARGAWLQKTLGMLGLAGATIWWTWETEDALQKMTAGTQSAMKVQSRHLVDYEAQPVGLLPDRLLVGDHLKGMRHTMRFGSTAKVPAKCKLEY